VPSAAPGSQPQLARPESDQLVVQLAPGPRPPGRMPCSSRNFNLLRRIMSSRTKSVANELEEQIADSNQNLKVAEADYETAKLSLEAELALDCVGRGRCEHRCSASVHIDGQRSTCGNIPGRHEIAVKTFLKPCSNDSSVGERISSKTYST
jgi:hypothetical protein